MLLFKLSSAVKLVQSHVILLDVDAAPKAVRETSCTLHFYTNTHGCRCTLKKNKPQKHCFVVIKYFKLECDVRFISLRHNICSQIFLYLMFTC